MPNWYRPTALPIDPFGTPDRGYGSFRVTSPWGWRDNPLNPGQKVFHGALDLGNGRLGDTVVAVADGTVAAVGNLLLPWSQPTTLWPSGNYGGLMVILDHGTHVSLYAHLMSEQVAPGQQLRAGDPIGRVGESGSATGRGHLHFGIIARTVNYVLAQGVLVQNSWTVDPWPLIEPMAHAANPDTALPGGEDVSWVDNAKPQPPMRVAFEKVTNVFNKPELGGANVVFQLQPGQVATVCHTVQGTEYPAGSGNKTWDAYATFDRGWVCYPSATRGKLSALDASVDTAGMVGALTLINERADRIRALAREINTTAEEALP